jgi:hypothetical protein
VKTTFHEFMDLTGVKNYVKNSQFGQGPFSPKTLKNP